MGREHWVETTLDNVVLHKKGKKPKKLERSEFPKSIPYIDIEAFETGKIKQFADIASSNCCDNKDVLVVWDGARFGLTGYNQRGSVGSTLACLTPVIIETTYLLNFIQRCYSVIQSNPKGTGIPHVNPDIFWNLTIPLPPLNEQKRIVEKLDAILPKVKNAKARLEKIPVILKKFRQSILAAACSGRLTEEWRVGKDLQNWEEVKLKDVGTIGRGKSKNRPRNDQKLFNGPYPFIQTGDISQSGGFITSHSQTYNDLGLAQSKLWPEKTLCITIAANIANTAILTYPACFPDSVVGFISNSEKSELMFIKWIIDMIKNDLENYAPATAQKNINLGILNDVVFKCPSLEEQNEIVRRVEKLFAIADSLEARYRKAMERVEKIEQAVLAKAFRGELVEPDPNDEPAEELLKRILEEKAALDPGMKKKKRTANVAIISST
ncbi:MAG: restriction endonuclease subunit S [Chlorobiaceae bacterium]